MGIEYKKWSFTKVEPREMSESVERKYLELFRRESEQYVREAEELTASQGGLYWSATDDAVMEAAKAAEARRSKIKDRLFSPLASLNKTAMTHKPLTDELVQERREAMLQAVAIYRDASSRFAGSIGQEYQERVDELERKANKLKAHSDTFNIDPYLR